MSIKMKELPVSERPYEKLEMYGAKALSSSELLAIIIKTGTKNETSVSLAQKILKLGKETTKDDLSFLQELSVEELCTVKGIGKVKAIGLIAVCELAKRMSRPIDSLKIKITNSSDVANFLMEELRYEKREIAKVIILNSKNLVLKVVDISYGGTSFVNIEPKDALLDAVKMGAPKIILVHNHPSGNPAPSNGDFEVTDRIYESAQILGIKLIDHVIIGNNKFESVFAKMKGM